MVQTKGKWRNRLYSYTAVAVTVGLWLPLTLFIADVRDRYDMHTFELLNMRPTDVVVFLVLCVATVLAQYGCVAIANELAKRHKTSNNG